MPLSPCTKTVPSISAPLQSAAPRQMCIAFESAVLLDLTSSERASVITQLASLLVQAAGQAGGDDDGEL